MGLIRSGNTELTPMSDEYIRAYFADIKGCASVIEKRLEEKNDIQGLSRCDNT